MLEETLCLVAVTPQLFTFMISRFLQGAGAVHGEIDSHHSWKENSANTPLIALPTSSVLGLCLRRAFTLEYALPESRHIRFPFCSSST